MNDLARVARATNQAEAEFVQSLLLDAGIPSMLRRSPGFDVPDMLAAGPRDVIVPSAAHDAARDVLLQAEIVTEDRALVDPRTREWLPARALRTVLEAMRIYPLPAVPKPRLSTSRRRDNKRGFVGSPGRGDARRSTAARRSPDARHAATAPRVGGCTRSARAA